MAAELRELSEWWVADDPEHRVQGELRFDVAEGASLVLLDLLPGLVGTQFATPTLHGEAFDGTAFTLINPVMVSRRSRSPKVRVDIRAIGLLKGAHADDPEAVSVERAKVRLTGVRDLCHFDLTLV